MFRYPAVAFLSGWSSGFRADGGAFAGLRALAGCAGLLLVWWAAPAQAVILWSDLGATLVHATGPGSDILGGALKRDDASTDTLYFKFHVAPLSDTSTEEYFAAFELFEGEDERLGVGNALKAWAYSAFFNTGPITESSKLTGYIDLHSANPEPSGPSGFFNYELPRRGTERTIIFKVQYVPGAEDLVTVWLNPDLGPGANEVYQPETLTTRLSADASFDEIRLRHAGGGDGWVFSDMAIATAFNDFVDTSSAKPGGAAPRAIPGALALGFQSWQRQSGMPHDPIRALAQTRDGYLWVGSDDGLARFDGVRFVAFEPQQGYAMPVRALCGDSRGRLWIGTTGGLACYQEGRFTTFTVREGLPVEAITALAEDNEGRLWVGTEAGLFVGQNGRFESFGDESEFKGKSIAALFRDPQGNMWLAASGAGLFQFRQGKFVPITDASMEGLLQAPHCLLVDKAGRLWLGAGDDFVLCREGSQWRRYRVPRHLARHYVRALAEEPDGTVWAGSASEGLFQFKDGNLVSVNASSGLSDNLVESLLVDAEGALWVGTDSGLSRMRRKNLFGFGQEQGLGSGDVLGLAEVAPGVVWAAKRNDGLYRWEGANFSRLVAAGLPSRGPRANALLVAKDGSCWLGCARGLLRFKDPQAAADEGTLVGLANTSIGALAEDAEGRIWAGTREGELWRLGQGRWARQTGFWGTNAITAIVPDIGGAIWIGTDGAGLFHIKGETHAQFGRGSGLSSDSIRTLYLGAQGTLWIGTAGGGLSWWRNGRLATCTAREGLPDDTISQIVEDDAGRLWLGTGRGIAAVSKQALSDLAAGKAPAVYPQVYGRVNGMLSEECTSGFFPAGLKTKAGLLWFSTRRGAVVIDPRHHRPLAYPPPVVLEGVLIDGVAAPRFRNAGPPVSTTATGKPAPETLRIPPGKHRFELQYTCPSFDAPDQVRFRYRLDGLDADWVEAGARRTAFYNYVPPGSYLFRVIACDSDGVWNETGAAVALTVSRHFWQVWWVIALAAVGLLGAVGGTVRLVEKRRLQRRLKGLEQERALERERTRIAQDLHDEMGAKLCRISFLSEHVRRVDSIPAEVGPQVASISDASREVLHSLDEIVWAVNPKNDTLEHAVSYIGQYAQEYFQGTGIECELDMPRALPPHPLSSKARHHLFLAVREALANILKHSRATRCTISMACTASAFEIAVGDNGAGFNPAIAQPESPGGGTDSGNGLRNMRQRLLAIGGDCQLTSAPGKGTTVGFVVPLTEPIPTTER